MAIDLTGGMSPSRDFFLTEQPEDPQFRESASFWVSDDKGLIGLPRVGIEAVSESWDQRGLQVNLGFPDGGQPSCVGSVKAVRRWTPMGCVGRLGLEGWNSAASSRSRRWPSPLTAKPSIPPPHGWPRVITAVRRCHFTWRWSSRALRLPGFREHSAKSQRSCSTRVSPGRSSVPGTSSSAQPVGSVKFGGRGVGISRIPVCAFTDRGLRDVGGFWGHCWPKRIVPERQRLRRPRVPGPT